MRTFLDNDYDGGITGTSQNWNGVQVYVSIISQVISII